ncbi:unnamed protein product [Lathyrus sativus]|nr:unnamed protein product [Lathyrus sativus]
MENKLLQPLLPHFNHSSHEINQHTNNNTNNNIIRRILFFLFVALISIWANYEASKTFDIYIVNDTKDSLAGHRFTLFYISNDKAARIVLNTSSVVEKILYPNSNHDNVKNKKNIKTVTLRLVRRNLNTTTRITTAVGENNNKNYVIEISSMLLEDESFNEMVIVGEIQRAMARIWLWDGRSRAPPRLLNGMAEYVAELAGFRREWLFRGDGELPECEVGRGLWWEDKDPTHVARLLNYCENYEKGFIQRLNEALIDTWHDRVVDDLLGLNDNKLCGLYNASYL